MSPLRFLMLTTFYPPHNFGGDGIGIQRLARGLVKRGHHVTVAHDADAYAILAPSSARRAAEGAGGAAHDNDEGVEVVRLRSTLPMLSTFLTQQFGHPVINAGRLRRLIADGRYDVVNFHNISLIGGPGLLRYGGGAITLYMAHEHWLVCPTHVLWRHGRERCTGRECVRCTLRYRRPPQLWRYTGLLDRELEHVDSVIAMSEFSRRKHREFGLQRDMEVLPYFLPDPDGTEMPQARGASPHERPYFFFAGRLERIKGVDDVIPAFRNLTGADLLIAGDGTHAPALRALAEGMPNVRFLGRIAPDDLRRYYQHAVALIVPSECYETFGIVLIESFRQGTPVIARRLGPFPEIVETSGGGELFGTRDELVQAMHRLLDDPAHRERLSRAGYQAYVSRWSEQVVVPQYLDIVRRAAERREQAHVVDALATREVA